MIEEEYQARLLQGRRRIPHLRRRPERLAGAKTVDFAPRATCSCLPTATSAPLAIMLANKPKAKMIWAHTGSRTRSSGARLPGEIPGADDGVVLSRRDHARRRRCPPNGARCSPAFRPLPAGLRYLGEPALDELWLTMRGYRDWLAQLPEDQARALLMAMRSASMAAKCRIDRQRHDRMHRAPNWRTDKHAHCRSVGSARK